MKSLRRVSAPSFGPTSQATPRLSEGPGPGDGYIDADDPEGKEWAASTGRAAAQNLVGVARALAAEPLPAPPD